MKIILLNGPRHSGKDTAAAMIDDITSGSAGRIFRHEKFSAPHKRAFAAMTKSRITEDFVVEGHEERKLESIPWLGTSYVQWQIDFSEKFMKPLYGNTVFARMFLSRIAPWRDSEAVVVAVSDCGFQIEADTVLESFDPRDVLLIQLYRPGKTFEGDSREYVSVSDPTVPGRYRCCFAPMVNAGSLDDFKKNLRAVVTPFLRGEAPLFTQNGER